MESGIEIGAWVKLKSGTQGMTVIAYEHKGDGQSADDLAVCRFRNSEGKNEEHRFRVGDLNRLKES